MALEVGSSYEAIAHIIISSIYSKTGKCEKALEEINIALQIAFEDDAENAYLSRAEIYRFLGQPQKAIEDLRYLYNYYENTNYVFWTIADIYDKEEKFHLAALEMNKLLHLEPYNERAKQYRDHIFHKIEYSDYQIAEE